MIELVTDLRIALIVNFVSGKNFEPWTDCALVQFFLLLFNLDILFARFDLAQLRI